MEREIKRLFIEIDSLKEGKLKTDSSLASDMHGFEMTQDFFDTIIDNAHKNKDKILEALKIHDEIYASTALIPRGSETSGDLFNGLMSYAISKGIEGKSVFLLRRFNDIFWGELEKDLVDKCFRKNFLYFHGEDYEAWYQVDIDRLIKEKLTD